MKTAPVTYTEMAIGAGVLVLGYLAWRAYKAVPKTLAETVEKAASAVDQRQTGGILAAPQSWVDETVRKGQDAGASTFVTAFFSGLVK